MFTFGLLFANIIPLTTLFSCIFFTLKYFIEKYNTIYVYQKEFEARGRLRKQILPFSVASMMGCQFINYAFIGYYRDRMFFYIGCASIGVQLIMALLFYVRHLRKKSREARASFERSQSVVTCGGSPSRKTAGGPGFGKMEEKLRSGFLHPFYEIYYEMKEYYRLRAKFIDVELTQHEKAYRRTISKVYKSAKVEN